MGIKQYRPLTNGQRGMSVSDFAEITKTTPEKSLVKTLGKTGGRNSRGLITKQHRGGGARKRYRIIDFKRNDRDGIQAKVAAIEYDPNRSAYIALLHYTDGIKRYMIAPLGLKAGMRVVSGVKTDPDVGNCMELASMPIGITIHNIEMNPGQGGKLVRAAGNAARLMARDGGQAVIELPSGELRRVSSRCRATIGQVGNIDYNLINIGKAGKKRHMGIRPIVRGSCRNPVDHPMGGGEGRRSGGRDPKGPSGVLSKGGKTRKRRALSNKDIIRRRKK